MQNLNSFLFGLALIAGLAAAPSLAAQQPLSAQAPTVTQNFDAMATGLSLPEGWKIDRNLKAPRTVGAFADASTTVMYEGGKSLASNAKNGTWNFGSSTDPSDRAIGGLTTTVDNGTRCINLMTSLRNDADLDIERFSISYNIEKYRNGDNPAGFAIQLYTSTDGTNWTSAGSDFYTKFDPDSKTLGEEVVPISTTAVTGKNLLANVAPGSTIYLAWNISVASGSSPNKAPGYALDDIEITAIFADSSVEKHSIFVEDHTGWDALAVYGASDAFGAFPGLQSIGSTAVNGVPYKVFEHTAKGNVNIEINNSATTRLPAIEINAAADNYICATPTEATVIANPESYTGWVDPNKPVHVPSGIYLRGDVNTWSPVEEWEFSDLGNGEYILYDKTLSGAFKVADASWSSACNYGSNGTNIFPDTPYALKSGTDDNISCGSNVYAASEIRLTIANGSASLLIKSNDDPTGLTKVYMVGDFNNWNYMNTDGALTLDTADGLYKGFVSMPASANGNLSRWRIYQRLGKGGAWGASGADMTESSLSGTLVKGSTYNAAVAPGSYDVTFNLSTGEYTFTKKSAAVAGMTLNPTETVLVKAIPEKVKILSLNNSLIYYNDQDAMFNDIARNMGKDAVWTKHTLLGKSLNTHWDEGEGLAADGTPSAKMLVRSEAWSHIILQEQSAVPRTNVEQFRASVKKWIEYIRANCPNPNAIIIIPMNWAYGSDWSNFTEFNAQFARNYLDVATDAGIVICPVASAYQRIFEAEGSEGAAKLFLDDRHPTPKATYLAACMEYQLIFNENAFAIKSHPASVTDEEAASMRSYASATMNQFVNPVNHHKLTIDYSARLFDEYGIDVEPAEPFTFTANDGGTFSGSKFTANGTLGEYTVTAASGQFSRTAKVRVAEAETVVITYPAIELNEDKLSAEENFDAIGNAAEASLPEGWRIDRQTVAPRTVGSYGVASEKTTYAGGVNLPANAKNGIWNFGDTQGTDRALGGITTGVANGTRAINLYAHLHNNGAKNIEKLNVAYDIEKYRKGNNPAGFAVQLYYSVDGRNWTSAGADFYTKLEPDAATEGYAEVPGETVGVSATLPVDIERGCDLYLAWNISTASGDACNAAMALAIDNFSISGSLPEVPVAEHYIYVIDNTGWASLGLYAYGDSEFYGAWPGQIVIDQREIDGKTYKVFPLDTNTGNYTLIFNNWNNGKQTPDYPITANRDFYFEIDANTVKEIDPFSAIEDIDTDFSAETEYYSLQGIKVAAPVRGQIYIARQGSKAAKILFR